MEADGQLYWDFDGQAELRDLQRFEEAFDALLAKLDLAKKALREQGIQEELPV